MNIIDKLLYLAQIKYLAAPKTQYGQEDLIEWFGTVTESSSSWLIPCAHRFFDPCEPRQLLPLATWLEQDLPKEIENLYFHSNGAELFKINYKSKILGAYSVVKYDVFDIAKLLVTNQGIYKSFRSQIRPTSKYWEIIKLNYFAFCSVGDGDYLAVSLDRSDKGSVFFLDHEYGFLPYDTENTRDAYIRIAPSLTEWIEILIQTFGEGGTGARWIPL